MCALTTQPLKALAATAEATLATREKELKATIKELTRIAALPLLSEDGERKKALRPTDSKVAAAEEALRLAGDGLAWNLQSVMAWVKAGVRLRSARKERDTAIASFELSSERQARYARIRQHNESVRIEQARISDIEVALDAANAELDAIRAFCSDAKGAFAAARGSGWIREDFAQQFSVMERCVMAGVIDGARQILEGLVFQRQPKTYEGFRCDARSILAKAYSSYPGAPAAGAFPEIAECSVRLAKAAMREDRIRDLDNYQPADRWRMLSEILTDPLSFRLDAMWSIYWGTFQCSDSMAKDLSRGDRSEESLTGSFVTHLTRWTDWTAQNLPLFGYPEIRSYAALLDIAHKPEESRLGADLGVIVDINVGDHVCRKVALFQAKNAATGGKPENIGSKKKQLGTLAGRGPAGFYLFFHRSSFPLQSPGPTVSAAEDLARMVKASGRDLDGRYKPVDVRRHGWDWANFVTFGLCQPESGIGQPFLYGDNPLKILSDGNEGRLPSQVCLIALANEREVQALELELKDYHYAPRHYEVSLERSMEDRRDRDRGIDRERKN
ncbi:hypothetical protein AWB81_07176 [Caballeronia arationis]|uniref:hypothetical protein n=1 Tax=Caballeronia arationis TaxID=1777142 RepID=UPI00074C537A|nr:hypothetical protein [Caballeronia arationis]SAL05473.1 hypothetical protein AWB81_07176 [Caballeronia arationis]